MGYQARKSCIAPKPSSRHAKLGSADDSAKRFTPPFAAVPTADRANGCLYDHSKDSRSERITIVVGMAGLTPASA
jgi:hypothetical protein